MNLEMTINTSSCPLFAKHPVGSLAVIMTHETRGHASEPIKAVYAELAAQEQSKQIEEK